ncbi:DUF6531 domain-containing protein [Paraburkholderia sp. MM5477-R1]|uniref:DUF6531 domain-containing protein n=1 Tax=Paraburkholderia sp. MM5477-R1 TaxID=2991062 RepID=UPI003D1D7960
MEESTGWWKLEAQGDTFVWVPAQPHEPGALEGPGPAPTGDGTQPEGSDSPATLGAPNPPDQQQPPPARPPTSSDGGNSAMTPGGGPSIDPATTPPPTASGIEPDTPLADQYFRPVNPIPDYAVLDQLMAQGLSPEAAQQQFAQIMHNEPPPDQPHPMFGKNDRRPAATLLDPVDPFAGQYVVQVTDVAIPGRELDLRLTRTYRSGVVYFGPWGFNWDHNYNITLRELDGGAVAVWMGALHEDVYRPDPGGFRPPLGVFRFLERRAAPPNLYVLTDREGLRLEFDRPAGWPLPERIPLVRIVDRHRNVQSLDYDVHGRLQQVADGHGRYLRLRYGTCGLLEQVVDHTGRMWRYEHESDVEHLVAVTSPPTAEFPVGVTTHYRYDRDNVHPAMRHNMTQVIGPSGSVICENIFGADPLNTDFNRVIFQRFDRFEASFTATELQIVPRVAANINIPTLRVEVIDPGFYYVYTYNFRGDLLDERYRLVSDGSYRMVARSYQYDDQGNLTGRREPNGLGMLYTYDNANVHPRARGNLLKLELVAPPTSAAASRVLQILTYEPQFHRPKSLRDEVGNVTTWIYDYEVLMGSVGDVVRIEYPDTTLPDGSSQARVERFSYNAWGQLSEHRTGAGHRHVFSYGNVGMTAGYLISVTWDADGAAQTEGWEYDAQGHRRAFIDGLGNRTETTIDALDCITAVRLPPVAGKTDAIYLYYSPEGRVRREEWPRGAYSDAVITDPYIAHEYTYDVLGNLSSAVYGVNTERPLHYAYEYNAEHKVVSVRDPLGRITNLTYDQRGLLVGMIEAAGSSQEAAWSYTYDRNGNRTAVIDPVGHRFDYVYDAWDRLIALDLPGAPDPDRTRVEFTLNRFDRADRVRITGAVAPGLKGILLDSYTDFDERGRPWRRTVDARTTLMTYDADDRVIAQSDQRGSSTTFQYDGLNRIVQATDAIGNVLSRTFDAAGNLTIIRSSEMLPGGAATETFEWTVEYDSRRRRVGVTEPLGRVTRSTYDARDLEVANIDPLGRSVLRSFGMRGELLSVTSQVEAGSSATHTFEYDAAGRQTTYRDPEGEVTSFAYDDRDRRIGITYPDGRVHRFLYGIRRQPDGEVTPGGTSIKYIYGGDAGLRQIEFTPGAGVAPTSTISLFSDGLRRPTRLTQGGITLDRMFDASLRLTSESCNGQTARIEYDDPAGMARLTYPDGRVDRMTFDAIGRISSVTLMTPTALTGVLAAGTNLAKFDYRGPRRVARRQLCNGVVTTMDYDGAARLTAIRHTDAGGAMLSTVRYVYDAGDRRRLVWSNPGPQQTCRIDYDDVDRVRGATFGIAIAEPGANLSQMAADAAIAAAAGVPGISTESYVLNRSDVRTEWKVTSPASSTTHTYVLNSAWEIERDVRTGSGMGTSPFAWDADGRCTQDDRFNYVYDALGRLVEVRSLSTMTTVLTQRFDPAGRVMDRTDGTTSYGEVHLGYRSLARTDGNGHLTLHFTPGLAVDEILMESTGINRFPLQDPTASVLLYTDASGEVVERYRYSPFGIASIFAPDGVTSRASSTIGGVARFGGHPLLSIDRYDARARVYDPGTGRFLQPDPLGYRDASNLYLYAHHDPIGFVDATGEAAILVGLAVAAGIGLVMGLGTDAIHQGLQLHEGSRREFSWGELGLSAAGGAIMGPVMVFAPEVGIPLAAYGAGQGLEEISQGHWESGSFDVAMSLLPFGLKGARSAMVGEGSVFSPARGLGPSATANVRYARFGELGRAAADMTGRIANARFYRGTTYYEALQAEQAGLDIANVRNRQVRAAAPPRLGPGLYFTTEPGAPNVGGSAEYWANFHGGQGQGGGPSVLEASVPRWRLALLRREPGVQIRVPQPNFPLSPASRESFFPFEGPNNQPPTGPGANFNAVAKWRLWDPNAAQPSLSSLLPPLAAGSARWPGTPLVSRGNK